MENILFYKTEKGLGNEDWYYYVKDSNDGEAYILHKWSHGGPFNFKSGERKYSIKEFEIDKPNQYKKFVDWLEDQ